MISEHTLDVPGARLYYEVRGSGPVLVVLGAPMAARFFAPLADALAGDYTVVTHDPRGIARSRLDDPEQDSTPRLRAGDVVAVLDALGAGSADVFGSSGGAVTGLALLAGHPDRVGTLVAHEPPVLQLLPDAAERRAGVEDILATFHRDGLAAAWGKFMASLGFDTADGEGAPAGPPDELTEQDITDSVRFFGHELRHTCLYQPDLGALAANRGRLVVGVGVESRRLSTYRTSVALAERLGITPVEFPGDHGGFLPAPVPFAEALRKVLVASPR